MNALANSVCEPLIDAQEASRILNLPKRTVLRLAKDKVIPGAKVGKVWRFWPSRLEAWLDTQMRTGKIA